MHHTDKSLTTQLHHLADLAKWLSIRSSPVAFTLMFFILNLVLSIYVYWRVFSFFLSGKNYSYV